MKQQKYGRLLGKRVSVCTSESSRLIDMLRSRGAHCWVTGTGLCLICCYS